MITTKQAEALAQYWHGETNSDTWDAIGGLGYADDRDRSAEALARWVLLWADTVRAAEIQTDARDAMGGPPYMDKARRMGDATYATEAAVRVARGQAQEAT